MSSHSIILPSKPRIVKEDAVSGVYEIDGLYPGYGHTLGNSLRRIILSSLPGAAITQVKIDGVEHVIEYSSKTCNRHERNYCPTEGELLAIIYGLAKYRSYLLGQIFTIVTDHSALQYLNTSKASAKLARWGLFLSEFNFTIKYRKGTAHCNADALSRLPALPDD